MRRVVAAVLLGVAVLAVLVPLALWVHYRLGHVVSDNALVKGAITQVGTQLAGVVTSVEVDVGEHVQAGQVLARYEDRQLRADAEGAVSRLEKASRELEVERLAIEQERRLLVGRVTEAAARAAAATAQVEAAKSQADGASERLASRKSLAQLGLISQEELRNAWAEHRTALALRASAQAEQRAAEAVQRLAEVESDGLAVRTQRVVVLEAEVATFRAELARAEADLRAAVIRAPADGWVVRRIVEPGASVVVGAPVVALWIGQELWVEAWIPEEDLAQVAVGSPVSVTVTSYPDREFAGVVEAIGVSTDYELPETAVPQPRNTRIQATPVVGVRVRLDEAAGLFPGLSAVVGIRKTDPRRKSGPPPSPRDGDGSGEGR